MGFSAEVWQALLGMILGTLILVISIASQSIPKLIDLYMKDLPSLIYVWFLIVSGMHAIIVNLYADIDLVRPASRVFNTHILLVLSAFFAFPYIFYILRYTKPSNVIRRGSNTSMALAIKSVKLNKSNAMVSAGNTGALMAFSKLFLKTISGINRPEIAACFPTKRGEVCMLDLGANIECDKNNLIQFALMGQAFAKIVIGIKNPKVSLLNIGEEEIKGFSYLQDTSETLKKLNKALLDW